MLDIESITKIASKNLVFSKKCAVLDNYYLDKTQRIIRNIEKICLFPEVAESKVLIDMFCLNTAAWFCDTGYAVLLNAKHTTEEAIEKMTAEEIRDASISLVVETLSGKISDQKVDKINKIISETDNRFTNITEAIILSDARNLDDLGLLGIFNEIKRSTSNGKAVSDILQAWQKKIDYQYWQTRLKEGFRLDPVRNLASKRLQNAMAFMELLGQESVVADLEVLQPA